MKKKRKIPTRCAACAGRGWNYTTIPTCCGVKTCSRCSGTGTIGYVLVEDDALTTKRPSV